MREKVAIVVSKSRQLSVAFVSHPVFGWLNIRVGEALHLIQSGKCERVRMTLDQYDAMMAK